MFRSARRLSVSGVLAATALFVSLGGVGAAATGAFSGRQIANHTIPLSKLTPAALQLLRALPNHVATDTGDHFSLARLSATGAVEWTDQAGLKAKRMEGDHFEVTVPAGTFKASSPLVVLVTAVSPSTDKAGPYVCEANTAQSASDGSASIQIECGGFSAPGTIPSPGLEIVGPA